MYEDLVIAFICGWAGCGITIYFVIRIIATKKGTWEQLNKLL